MLRDDSGGKTTAHGTRRTRGRPRDPGKRFALLVAARALFLEHGADVVTVDQVIAGAGVSRATYYSNFADRDDLLAAVIGWESERIVTDDAAKRYEGMPLREALVGYGDGFMRFLADPDTMRLEPLILHVRQSRPDLAATFFAIGPRRVWDILADIVRGGQRRGELSRDVDPEQAVGDLIGLWRGSWCTEVMYGHRALPDEDELGRRCRHAVDLFLRAWSENNQTDQFGN